MSDHQINHNQESVETEPVAEPAAPVAAPCDNGATPAAPVEKTRKPRKPSPRKPEPVLSYTTKQRLEDGAFSINEAAALCGWSREKIYADRKRGLVELKKNGGRTVILGPELVRYRAGGGA
ncbi:MAG TPA: hypothetical protein VIF02_01760 [Methylocella sp.]|jgi:hypothetical protein